MLLLCHGQDLIVAEFDIAEADKNPVGHGAVPHLWVGQRSETDLVKMGLHIQQQTAAGHEIDLQDISVHGLDR